MGIPSAAVIVCVGVSVHRAHVPGGDVRAAAGQRGPLPAAARTRGRTSSRTRRTSQR